MRILRVLGFVLTPLVIAGAIGYGLYTDRQNNANVLFLDNTHSLPVEVNVGGQTQSLEPGEVVVVEVEAGVVEVSANAAGAELSRETITVTDGEFRGLYDVVGSGNYVVVTAIFAANGGSTTVEALPVATNYHLLPEGTIRDGIDEEVPTVASGASDLQYYLCRFDPATEAIGCPGV